MDDRQIICNIISEMLDNPNEYGIYPTTQAYDKLEAHCATLRAELERERERADVATEQNTRLWTQVAYERERVRNNALCHQQEVERLLKRLLHPTAEMEIAGMRALRKNRRTVTGAESREQARACWDAMAALAAKEQT